MRGGIREGKNEGGRIREGKNEGGGDKRREK